MTHGGLLPLIGECVDVFRAHGSTIILTAVAEAIGLMCVGFFSVFGGFKAFEFLVVLVLIKGIHGL
jgi:hypothetical protein